MTNYYKSIFYNHPIEVVNIEWEVIVTITDKSSRKIIYSWYDLIEKNTQSNYITKCILWGFIKKIPKEILIVWFWWWAFCKYIEDHVKWQNITWVDIDSTMFEIAKKELNIKTDNLISMEWEKAISELKNNGKKFDLVLIDVYWSEWLIPDEFLKKEVYTNLKEIINKDWVLSINYADYVWINIWKYNKIHHYLKDIFWENFIHLSSIKNKKWNISWIYNLDKKYSLEEINIKYLEKVKSWKILYDANMIKNTIINKEIDE